MKHLVLKLLEKELSLGGDVVQSWDDFEEDTSPRERRIMWRLRLLAMRERWPVETGAGMDWMWDICQSEFEGRH